MTVLAEPQTLEEAYTREAFDLALAKGFFLRAHERMIYLSQRRAFNDLQGWDVHRFVSAQGRLIVIRLPPSAQIYVWPAGEGPIPLASVCGERTIWGRVPPVPHIVSDVEDDRLHRLWLRSLWACLDPATQSGGSRERQV